MLPPFIIEQIRRREQQERQRQENTRPRVRVPIQPLPMSTDEAAEDDSDRGVVIVDLLG